MLRIFPIGVVAPPQPPAIPVDTPPVNRSEGIFDIE
jgi:hypothetical protein